MTKLELLEEIREIVRAEVRSGVRKELQLLLEHKRSKKPLQERVVPKVSKLVAPAKPKKRYTNNIIASLLAETTPFTGEESVGDFADTVREYVAPRVVSSTAAPKQTNKRPLKEMIVPEGINPAQVDNDVLEAINRGAEVYKKSLEKSNLRSGN